MRRTVSESEREHATRSPERAASGSNARSDPVAALHRAAGNQAVERLHRDGDLPTGPTLDRPGDRYEREADRVAERVVNAVPSGAARETTGEPDRTEPTETTASGGETLRRLGAAADSGTPLPSSLRSFFEARFDRDFGDGRIHTGARAGEAARALDATAFTAGRRIVLRPEAYRPGPDAGKRLLAHELAHVVQQRGSSSVPAVQRQRRGRSGPLGEPGTQRWILGDPDIREELRRRGYQLVREDWDVEYWYLEAHDHWVLTRPAASSQERSERSETGSEQGSMPSMFPDREQGKEPRKQEREPSGSIDPDRELGTIIDTAENVTVGSGGTAVSGNASVHATSAGSGGAIEVQDPNTYERTAVLVLERWIDQPSGLGMYTVYDADGNRIGTEAVDWQALGR